MLSQVLWLVVGWAQVHRLYSLEIEDREMTILTFIRTWEKDKFHPVTVHFSVRFPGDPTRELLVPGSVMAAASDLVPLVAVSGGWNVLADIYEDFLGSGYDRKPIEYTNFDLRLLKRCLQNVSLPVFGTLDPLSKTEFVISRLKRAEHRDWIMPHSGHCLAIITGELSMPSLVEVVGNIVGV